MRRLLFVAVAILFAWMQGMAQQAITVTGKVTDEKGASIAGATITEKGSRNATSTNADGTWSLQVRPKTKLIISYVGYESIETEARSGLTISLTPDVKSLSDVVVTGVGVATNRKKVPIDVASVSSKDFAPSATANVQQALDGQVAGAYIQQTSGTPGASYNITLRGINSLDGTNPLIMVDGVEMENLNNIDPSVVDHIEVVKGAAGGMLYGAQGANGVIQIFTKKGTLNGKMTINFNSKASIDNILTGKHPLLSTHHHYVTDNNNNLLDASGNPVVKDATGLWSDPQVPIATAPANAFVTNDKTYNLPIYDHLNQGFRQALTFTNSVSLTGGSPTSDYAITASQLTQQDVMSNAFSRTNFAVNLGLHPFKGFTFRTITHGIAGYENLINGNRFNMLTAYNFIDFTWKDSTGHYPFKTNNSSNQFNTLSENQWHHQNKQTLQIFEDLDFNYKFPRFFELDVKYGLDYNGDEGTNYYLNQTANLQYIKFNTYWGPSGNGALMDSTTRYFNQNGLYSGFFRTDWQKDFHSNLPVTTTTEFAYDYRKYQVRQFYAIGIGLPNYPPPTISGATTKQAGDYYQESITYGFLVNQTIDWGNLFGISGGVRSDYGSAFGAAYKAATFPRGTVYFRPSELMTAQQGWLKDWKVRAAYGAAGIQPNPYDRQITLNSPTLGNGVALALQSQNTNDSLKLATNYELEVGTDATITPFEGEWLPRLVFSGSYWHRKSKDIYQNAQVAPSTGYATRLDNLSTIVSHGVDISLDASVYNGRNISWDLSARWGYSRAIVTKVANGQSIVDFAFAVKQGQPLGLFYVQTPLHSITQVGPDGKTPLIPVANQGKYSLTSTGVVVLNSDNYVQYTPSSDLSIIGHAYPDFTSSLTNRFTFFRKLSLSFQFDWVYGNSIYNVTRQWLYRPTGGTGGQGGESRDLDQKLTIQGQTGSFVNYYNSLYNVGLPVSPFIENGSYIRLRDLSIGYDLSRYVAGSKAIKRLTITASGRNLLTFTKYSGLDPENTGAFDENGNDLSRSRTGAFSGVDYYGTPNLRSYQFSLNVGF
ncbi:SusC/RagA family TonB-linked outer membrane protein [Puia dinghuensis]|uniref:SusC/RagA family TonB-linked outer membrane protein n=1 Tax=Puia dinghuensis TaxID=1792502 RepID=A0A8J2UH68_9BACT|nr:SusC/RagA family TonB-linked outer membrane protein [Puia dinghuensis]GGB17077.1 SusC/RagA family TonB-linked outer membrane protein [Puia dinghuensis]